MRWNIALITLVLAACGGSDAPVSEPEPTEPAPERILYRDIEEYELFGASCAFAPEGGGIGAIAIAMLDAGYIKFDGEIVKLVPLDEGQELAPPEMKFTGEDFGFSLVLDEPSERAREDGGREFDARLAIRSRNGTTIYNSAGLAQCGA